VVPGVLIVEVCDELVEVSGVEDVEVTTLEELVVTCVEDVEVTTLDVALVVVTTDVLVTTLVEVVDAVVVAPPPPPPPPPPVAPGGSRCKISASEVASVRGVVVIVVPAVRPLVLDLRKRDWNEPLFGITGVRAISVQLVPS